jgi:arylformamidase
MMQPKDYPSQDKLSDFSQPYAEEVMHRGADISGEDILYGSNPYQSIGIHKPLQPNGSVFAFIHGGGWTNGYKEWNNFMAPAFTSKEITFVSIGYRLAPMHIFPQGEHDCAAAVAWIYKNISKFGGDPLKLYLGGHSAGGHYASLLSVKDDWQYRAEIPTSAIRGCIPISGVYNFGDNSGLANRPQFLGKKGSGTSVAASPINYLEHATCPFLIAYGENDFPHLITQAIEMELALEKLGSSVERTIIPNADHFGAHYASGKINGDLVTKILNFISL